MYSVFIVDDEHIVLEGIRNKIDWENSRFSFAGEAADGELAFSMIQEIKPDILITDIKMPFMDGLELSRLAKKVQPWIKIIILSGHDEFEYAKRAISIGVEDYILKPFTHEELLSSLNKTADSLDRERRQLSDITRLRKELEDSTALRRAKFLSDLVLGRIDAADCIQKAAELHIELASRFYKVVVCEIRDEKESGVLLSSFRSVTESRGDVVQFVMEGGRLVLIVKGASSSDAEDTSYSLAETLEHLSERDNAGGIVVSVIGRTVEHISELHSSWEEADKVLSLSRFWNKSRIINVDDIQSASDGLLALKENDPLVDTLKYAERSEIGNIVQSQMNLLMSNSGSFPVIASYLLVDVIVAVSKLVEDLGGSIKDVMPEILNRSFVDGAVRSEEVFASEITRILEKILEFRDSKMQGKYGDVILKAKDYIGKNYASQDTCLSSVAEAVHLSPNHFSTVFSQGCGMTFIEYLTNVRIEAAKKLLRESDMKGADIAYECGFGDPHYFSFIFKKNTGITPREYKNSCRTGAAQK